MRARATSNPQQVAEFQHRLLLKVLSQTTPPNGNGSLAQQGLGERRFESYLKQHFPGKIYTGLKLSALGCNYPYTPDFAYIDSNINLHVDIEVDEPYVYGTREPTHFQESRKDLNRNCFFSDSNWIVIRFSEEQVVCWPYNCCKTVAQAIAQVTGDSSILKPFVNILALQPVKQWTEAEARQMAFESYRDKYLHKVNKCPKRPA